MLPSKGNVFTEPLSRNGHDISVHLAVVAQQRLYALQYELSKIILEKMGLKLK
jgi:hypothetical protein